MITVLRRMIFWCWIIMPAVSFSQESNELDVRDIAKANFFDPGFSFEKRIGNSQTLYMQAFMSTSIAIGYSSALGNTSSINSYPALTFQYRYYYNGKKRESKGKRTEMNSMNYVSVMTQASYYKDKSWGQNESRILKIFGGAWGFQRNYANRFSIDFNFGLCYAFGNKTVMNLPDEYSSTPYGEVTNCGQISLGFWLNKKE